MDNWFAWAVGIYFLSMVLYGHYRGFVRLSISLVAGVAALVLVSYVRPYVVEYVKEDVGIHQWAKDWVAESFHLTEISAENTEAPSAQRIAIENLNLPEQWKDVLLENNNSEIYRLLGVEQFADYISTYLTDMLIQIVSSALLFIIIFLALRLTIRWLNLLTRLPVLYGLNHVLGAVLGAAEALFLFWIFCMLLPVFGGTSWGAALLAQIEGVSWVTFLYQNNLIGFFLRSALLA